MTSTKVTSRNRTSSQAQAALEFAKQAEKLGYRPPRDDDGEVADGAVKAIFVTGQDPLIETASGDRLPPVPVEEAVKLNDLRDQMKGREPASKPPILAGTREAKDGTIHGAIPHSPDDIDAKSGASLVDSNPVYYTNPLFPPLPMYGPPRLMTRLHCYFLRLTSFFGSLAFLATIVLGAAFTSIPLAARHIQCRLKGQDPDSRRPFHEEELRRKKRRREEEKEWERIRGREQDALRDTVIDDNGLPSAPPTEGGRDPLVCDAAYYARREGLGIETFDVETEDGFVIQLWHVFDPRERKNSESTTRPRSAPRDSREDFLRANDSPTSYTSYTTSTTKTKQRYPILLMHGLLQSAGAYCCTGSSSLAFYLHKSGYDIWLGNNRCGFQPRHTLLPYSDPRMWSHNIRSFGNFDLAALISAVLSRCPSFPKLALVAHSQGTTQTFVALAKEQRPDIGSKISVFCAIAPAVYAGPLIKKFYFKIMRVITPGMFRLLFGIHAFIPFMLLMHSWLPAHLYGSLGYRVFSFLFNWSDDRWEQDLRDRFFQFSPTYVSAESMRWWLGRECFARHKCILATRREGEMEDQEDEEEDAQVSRVSPGTSNGCAKATRHDDGHDRAKEKEREKYAWYDARAPPMAFWIAGSDDLVDGRRLLRRFERGREPCVQLVHAKVIEEYEHLDVIWAVDCVEKVGREIRSVVWRTVGEDVRGSCRVPFGCEDVLGDEMGHAGDVDDVAADEEVVNRKNSRTPKEA